jgi:hypothetical protein
MRLPWRRPYLSPRGDVTFREFFPKDLNFGRMELQKVAPGKYPDGHRPRQPSTGRIAEGKTGGSAGSTTVQTICTR